jgi:hypothetical protein
VQHFGTEHVFACHPDRSFVGYAPEDFATLPPAERSRYQIIRGHFGYGLHELCGEPCKYITVLRDPVERAISHYYYVLKRKDHYLHKKVTSENIGLKEYVVSGITGEMDNGQLRMLAGDAAYRAPFGTCSEEHLAIAKQNLKHDFLVVGISERFDETLLVLREVLNIFTPFYLNQKVNNKRPKRDTFSEAVITAIRQHNQLDDELYRYANELLDELIATKIPFFRFKLALFRLRLRLYGKLFAWSRALPKSVQEKLDIYFFKIKQKAA